MNDDNKLKGERMVFFLRTDFKKKLEDLAEQKQISISAMVRTIVSDYLSNIKKD